MFLGLRLTHRFLLVSSLLFLGVLLCIPRAAAAARASPEKAQAPDDRQAEDQRRHLHHMLEGRYVEGHIAFLRAELHIAPVQENLWKPVADAMREDVRSYQEAVGNMERNGRDYETATQYLADRVMLANLRAQGEARFLQAFRPLYDSLSDEQKRAADDLLIPHMPMDADQ